MMPRSTTDSTGISGSGTCSSRRQIARLDSASAPCVQAFAAIAVHHCAPGMRALQGLHLREQVAEVLAVLAALAVPRVRRRRRAARASPRASTASMRADQPAAIAASGGAMPAAAISRIDRIGDEQLGRETPELVERALVRARWLSAVPSPSRTSQPRCNAGDSCVSLSAFAAISASRASRRCCERRRRARAARHRAGTAARSCAEIAVRLLGERQVAGTRPRRADTRAHPRRGRGPRASPAYVSSRRAWPIRSSERLARPRSSSSAGACPIHSPRR